MDGRCAGPLLNGAALTAGRYRLEFDVGEYYRDMGVALRPAFLDVVVIDFGVAETPPLPPAAGQPVRLLDLPGQLRWDGRSSSSWTGRSASCRTSTRR